MANDVSRVYLDRAVFLGGVPGGPIGDRPAPQVAASDLKQYLGSYGSDGAQTTFTAALDGGMLVLRRPPGTSIPLQPTAPDTFRGSIGTVTFRRNASGAVEAFSIRQDRVWDLRFSKHP